MISNHIDYLFIELTCPADCSNSGVCDTSSGLCSCDTGRHGSDCSSKNLLFISYLKDNMKVLNVYYHEQSLIVLVMVCVQIKGLVTIQLDPAYAMKDLRETFVQVTTNIDSNSFDGIIKYLCLLLSDVSCPGIQNRCNGNGFCDLTNGACTCDEDYQGLDCSGNNEISSYIYLFIEM